MQLPRNLLALDVLQRHDALGQPPLFLHRVTQCSRKMVQLVAYGGEFGRAIRFHTRVIVTDFDSVHRIGKRLNWRKRAADDRHDDEEKRGGDG